MAERLQFLMDRKLNSFLEMLMVLKENNEKIESSNLKCMSNDIVDICAEIDASIECIEMAPMNVTEEEVTAVE